MKKLTLIIAALIMGFAITSCNTTNKKEVITKAVDEFFANAEQKLASINSAEDFMLHFQEFEASKDVFVQELFADYIDEEGNVKGFSEEDMEEITTYIYDKTSAYNKVEGAKAAEFIEPLITDYEAAVDALYNAVSAGQSTEGLVEQFEQAEQALAVFGEYDNVLPELQTRAQNAEAKLQEVIDAMLVE